jgi:RNA recognition motif-containing protein
LQRTRPGSLGDAVWSHDGFDGEAASDAPAAKSSLEKRLNSALRPGGGTRGKSDSAGGVDKSGWNFVLIENIFNVTQEELQDLFSKEGDVHEVTVDFDRSGRSSGLATVAFANKADAAKAVTKYNGASLENNVLKLSTVDSTYRFPRQPSQDNGDGEGEGEASSRPRRGGRGRGGFRGRRGQ